MGYTTPRSCAFKLRRQQPERGEVMPATPALSRVEREQRDHDGHKTSLTHQLSATGCRTLPASRRTPGRRLAHASASRRRRRRPRPPRRARASSATESPSRGRRRGDRREDAQVDEPSGRARSARAAAPCSARPPPMSFGRRVPAGRRAREDGHTEVALAAEEEGRPLSAATNMKSSTPDFFGWRRRTPTGRQAAPPIRSSSAAAARPPCRPSRWRRPSSSSGSSSCRRAARAGRSRDRGPPRSSD